MANPIYVANVSDLTTITVAPLSNDPTIVFVEDRERTSGNPFIYRHLTSPNILVPNNGITGSGTIYPTSDYDPNHPTNPKYNVWEMMYDGPINVQWFGAKGDGLHDDTAAFQAAINTRAASIYVPAAKFGYGYVINATGVIIENNGTSPNPDYALTIFGDNKVRSKIWAVIGGTKIFTVKSQFVKIESLDFEGRGTMNSTGIWIEAGTCTISDCYFGDLKDRPNNADRSFIGIFNKVIFTNDGHNIRGCHFQECKFGIQSDGEFKNSRIHEFCEFYNCDTAIKLDSQVGQQLDTEGVTIHNCAFYFCGNNDEKMPAIDLWQCPYTYIIDCMVDQHLYTALQMWRCPWSKLIGNWFACPKAEKGAAVTLLDNNSNTFINNCDFNDSAGFSLEIIGDANPPLHIVISNSSFYPRVDSDNVCDRLTDGHIFIKDAKDVLVQACNLYYNIDMRTPNNNCLTPPDEWHVVEVHGIPGETSVLFDACYINGNIVKGDSALDVRLTNCRNRPTSLVGYVKIYHQSDVTYVTHGLTVLSGQNVAVVATNSSDFAPISAAPDPNNPLTEIRFIRQTPYVGDIVLNFKAEVFNNF